MDQILYFFIYSFLGWICECLYCGIPAKKFINRGFLAGPYCPIYGVGAIVIIYSLWPFKTSAILVFLIGMVLTSFLEYLTSWLMEYMFHTRWWDYSAYQFQLHGRICLKNSILFGFMVLFVCYVLHPIVIQIITDIPIIVQHSITLFLSIVFIIDLVITGSALLRKNKDFQEVEAHIHVLYENFKASSVFDHDLSLIDMVQTAVKQQKLDEKLHKQLIKLHVTLQHLYTTHSKIHKRLIKAFPKQIEQRSRRNAEALYRFLHERHDNK